MDLSKKLALANKLKAQGINIGDEKDAIKVSRNPEARKVLQPSGPSFIQEGNTTPDGYIYGVPNAQPKKKWDPNEELSEMKDGRFYKDIANANRKGFSSVLQEVSAHPIEVPVIEDTQVKRITENYANNPDAIRRAKQLMGQLDSMDSEQPKAEYAPDENGVMVKKRVDEKKAREMSGSGVDYEMIKMIVENAVSKMMPQVVKKVISESKDGSGNTPSIKAMKMKDDGTFLFLDSEENVYECVMRYKGKNKKRRKA